MAYYRKRRYVKRRSPYRKSYRKRYSTKRRTYKPRGSLRSQRGLSRPKRSIRAATPATRSPISLLRSAFADSASDPTEEGKRKGAVAGKLLGAVSAGVITPFIAYKRFKSWLAHLGDPDPSGRNMWDDALVDLQGPDDPDDVLHAFGAWANLPK